MQDLLVQKNKKLLSKNKTKLRLDFKAHFKKALNADPNFSAAHLQLALLYQDEGDNQNVEDHFNSAIVSDSDQIHKLEKRGRKLIKKFQFQKAKQQFMKAHDKRNHCAEVYYQQSIYFQNQKKSEKQQVSLEKSIKMNPSHSDFHRDLGILLSQQNQLDDAKFQLEEALELNYADSQSHFNLGKINCQMKNYGDAEQHFLSALDINPQFVNCMVELADMKLKINQGQEAKKYYLRAKEIKPELKHTALEKIMG
jgi:Tfp pilus assembly protein PilF